MRLQRRHVGHDVHPQKSSRCENPILLKTTKSLETQNLAGRGARSLLIATLTSPALSVTENGDIAACPRAKVRFGGHKIGQLRK